MTEILCDPQAHTLLLLHEDVIEYGFAHGHTVPLTHLLEHRSDPLLDQAFWEAGVVLLDLTHYFLQLHVPEGSDMVIGYFGF